MSPDSPAFAEARDQAVAQLRAQSFTVLPAVYDADEVALMRRELEGLWHETGELPLYEGGTGRVAENIERWVTGLVFKKYLDRKPGLARYLVRPLTLEVLRGYLGETMWMESTTAVLSDRTRPYFKWHSHIGGIDDDRYRREGWRPRFELPQKAGVLLYLQRVDADNGQLLVYPRRPGDPTTAPFDPARPEWPGHVAVECPPGSVVIMEQALFHAVKPRTADGKRMFVGALYAAPHSVSAFDRDSSLDDPPQADELLRAALRHRPT